MALLLGMLQKTPEQHGIFKRTCVIKHDCSNVFYLMSYSCCQKICVRVCALLVLSYNMVNSQVPAKLLHSMHHVFFFPCKSVRPLPLPKVSPYLLSLLFPALL